MDFIQKLCQLECILNEKLKNGRMSIESSFVNGLLVYDVHVRFVDGLRLKLHMGEMRTTTFNFEKAYAEILMAMIAEVQHFYFEV